MNEKFSYDAKRFCKFLLEHYEPARTWVDPLGYCCWNMSHGFMAAVMGEDGNIVALGVARPVDRPGFGTLPFYANEQGRNLHIDLLVDIGDGTESIFAMRDLIFARFGPRDTVAMFRHGESDTALKVYPWDKYWRNVARIRRAKRKKEKEYVPTITALGA